MKLVQIMVMIALMFLFSALLYATDDECIHYNALVCLPHDPQSIFEYERYGDFDQYESWTIRPPGCDESNEVCCQDAVGEDSFCCCRQVDCEIGSKRCFGHDMIQECSDEFYPCIEWIPIKLCYGSNIHCQNAECVKIVEDGDQTDGDNELDSISEDGDQTDADKNLDSIAEDDDNKEQSSGGLKSNGCHLLDGSTVACFAFIALLAFLATLRKNRSSDG